MPSVGARVVKWYMAIFEKGATASAFLGATLLSLTTAGSDEKLDQVRHLAATGSTLFLVIFLLCLALPLLFEAHEEEIAHVLDGTRRGHLSLLYHIARSTLFLTVPSLVLGVTACLFRVMAQYAPAAGWTGFGFTMLLSVSLISAFVVQELFWMLERMHEKRQAGGEANGELAMDDL